MWIYKAKEVYVDAMSVRISIRFIPWYSFKQKSDCVHPVLGEVSCAYSDITQAPLVSVNNFSVLNTLYENAKCFLALNIELKMINFHKILLYSIGVPQTPLCSHVTEELQSEAAYSNGQSGQTTKVTLFWELHREDLDSVCLNFLKILPNTWGISSLCYS